MEIIKRVPFECCDHCEGFEPDLKVGKLFADDQVLISLGISCENEKRCKQLLKMIKEREERKNG